MCREEDAIDLGVFSELAYTSVIIHNMSMNPRERKMAAFNYRYMFNRVDNILNTKRMAKRNNCNQIARNCG